MSRFHVRCRTWACKARRVLKKHPSQYYRQPKCESCGRTGEVWRVDRWMQERNTRLLGCTCAGYAWAGYMSGAMHRRGSLKCWYRADGTQRVPEDEDYYNEVNDEDRS